MSPPEGHEECQATAALTLLEQGTDRMAAVRRAELALRDGLCVVSVRCLWRAMTVLLCAGDLMAADAALRRLENERTDQVADVLVLVRAHYDRLAGDLASARKLLERMAATAECRAVRELAVPFLVETLVASGEVEAAEGMFEEAGLARPVVGNVAIRPLLIATRGAVHLASGRFLEAFEDLSACARLPRAETSMQCAVRYCRGLAALAAKGDGRVDAAETAAARSQEAALAWGAPADVGWALYVRALVGSERATKTLEEAVELLEIARSPVTLAAACHELGIRLAAEGDDVAAGRRLERAAALARYVGDKRLAEQAEDVLSELSRVDRRLSLTRQELKIAELARTGYTNKQIARRLVLTVRTIEFHLSNVYRKLHISGRLELADSSPDFPRVPDVRLK